MLVDIVHFWCIPKSMKYNVWRDVSDMSIFRFKRFFEWIVGDECMRELPGRN